MTQHQYEHEARRLRPRLLRLAQHYLGHCDEAEDVVQDALLKLWLLHNELLPNAWPLAAVVVRNLCIGVLRRRHPQVDVETVDMLDEGGGEVDAVQVERVMEIVHTLPDLQQTVLHLRHVESRSMEEIALLTGSTEAAVRQSLSRARRRVRIEFVRRYAVRIGGVAVAVMVVAGVALWWKDYHDWQRIEARYGGSYTIVNGQRNDNLRQILPEVQQTLARADDIAMQPSVGEQIDETENELLNSISDPEERERIKRMLE